MRSGVLLMGAAGLLAIPAVSRRLWRTQRSRERARLDVGALVGGALLLEAALIVCAWPTVAHLFGFDTGHHFFPGGSIAGWVSSVLALGALAAGVSSVVRVRRRRARLRVEPWLGEHHLFQGIDVVVLPTDRHLAIALPGRPPQVVLSQGVVRVLSEDELDAVVRHEIAHLDHHHSRYLMVSAILRSIVGWVPPLRSSLDEFELSVECWADEVACSSTATRRAVRDALLILSHPDLGPGIAALSTEEGLSHRLDMLNSGPVTAPLWSRAVPFVIAVGLGVMSLVALLSGM